MRKFIILDTETTGLEEEDRIIQMGMIVLNEDMSEPVLFNELCNPGIPIQIRAMETHNIVPSMIEGRGDFKDTEIIKALNSLNVEENILIIHNAPFDLNMLRKEGFDSKMTLIDTLRCAKHLYPEAEAHRLQFFRYSMGLYREEQAEAEALGVELKSHDALGDCVFLKMFMSKLLEDMKLSTPNEDPIVSLAKLTSMPVFTPTLRFGKHNGKKLMDVARDDASYLRWVLNNIQDLDEDVRYSINLSLQS